MAAEHVQNHVLRKLAQADSAVFEELMSELEPHPMQRGAVLSAPRLRADYVYFIDAGIVSLVASTTSGSSLEVALVGRESVAGLGDALGTRALPYGLVVLLAGLAYRAPKDVIRRHILSCSALHGLLMECSQRMMHELAQSALCNRFHTSEQRLARWLLLTAERADTLRLELTHEFVAQMVGAPRSAVSEAASSLRDQGIIDYRRGVLTIRNAKRLHKVACECFDAVFERGGSPAVPRPTPPRGRAFAAKP